MNIYCKLQQSCVLSGSSIMIGKLLKTTALSFWRYIFSRTFSMVSISKEQVKKKGTFKSSDNFFNKIIFF